jgi:hypothetical protein
LFEGLHVKVKAMEAFVQVRVNFPVDLRGKLRITEVIGRGQSR